MGVTAEWLTKVEVAIEEVLAEATWSDTRLMAWTSSLRMWQQAHVRDRLLGGYFRKWVILGVLIGIVAGLGAILFFSAIDWSTQLFLGHLAGVVPPTPRGEAPTVVTAVGRAWAIPLVVVLGGLLSGVIVFTLAPEAEGHGTDAAIEAFHERGGRIRSRIPPIKLIASAITIGTGGSAGREGPTAQIAAGFGSWLGEAFKLDARDRRIAMAIGVGAGIGAIFKAPLGGALLSAEILYVRDFEPEAIIPGFIASVIGYTIFAMWSGWTPVFGSALGFTFDDPKTLGWYAVLGVVAAGVGIVYVKVFYGTRDLFHRIGVPPHVKPAIGGLLVGLIALRFPQVLAMGYGWLQFGLEGDTAHLAVGTMLILIVLKIVATSLTIGSGGSGGVFAPGLFIGGMVGGAMWGLLHGHVPGLPPQAGPFVVVGMGALFGGIAKAPIAVMLMVAEMTGEFSMIVPAMIATSVAYILTGNISIYENQVVSRADSPAHRGEFTIPLIQMITVGQAMQPDVAAVSPGDSIATAEHAITSHQLRGIPVVEHEQLVGMFTLTDALRAAAGGLATVGDVMARDLVVVHPTDTLHTALQRMARTALSVLPVVPRERPAQLLGVLTITEIANVLDQQTAALLTRPEHVRAAADDPFRHITVGEALSSRFTTAGLDELSDAARDRLIRAGEHAAVVLDASGALAGIATLEDLETATEGKPTVGDVATREVVFARSGQFVSQALAQRGAELVRQLPVVEEQEGRLVPVGLLRRADVLVAYLRGRERLAMSNPSAPPGGVLAADGVGSTELSVERLDRANGLTLAELKLPREALVTSVERDGRALVPRGHLRLLTGDRVRLVGARTVLGDAVEQFRVGGAR